MNVKKRIPLATAMVLILFTVLLTFQITYNFVEKQYQKKVDTLTKTQSDFSKLAQADVLIRENFKGAVEEDLLEDGLIRGYVSALSDPYSRYMSAQEYSRYQEEKKGSGTGIGARFTYDEKSGEVTVYAVFPSSPAMQSGLQKGDVLYKIGDTLVSDLGFAGAVQSLSGDAGSQVSITVKRRVAAQVLEMPFTLTRREMQEPTVNYEMLTERVGYVQIFDITSFTPDEFSAAVSAVTSAGAQGIVFDVRGNTGSDVEAACSMLDRLLPEGVLMKKIDHKGKESVIKSDAEAFSLPMSVITNSATACAPELFAATLRDFGAATLVGETTYGKGTLQTVVEMDDGSAILLSEATFTPPTSPGFEGVGVIPDVESKLAHPNPYLVPHNEDSQIQDAMKALNLS